MPKYEVLHTFKDLDDKKKLYEKGSVFPRPANKKVDEKRIEELSSTENKAGKALIRLVEDEEEKEGE